MLKQAAITIVDTVEQGKGNIVSDMGGEKVMLHVANSKYYNLGEVGGRIWDLIETPIAVSQLVYVLTAEYQVEKEQCEEHVLSFLNHLLKEELIHVDEK
ncbi:lasso peptide biosynthesis PqqD family chaperone [Paenibacillus roseipurpureus]|uniref:Lasso peptide biosynthesis PqqD family chaperone n=1 Tax=Paenibacillus roseopurpureus TaxID=2918901 RepID=A0AA96LQ77_9BACL|nr:lasso peptide biosynthesis PqqD family chaperone [Paenibacillus sp. MBLB1832]WNR43813.1 lasso peptide biosynthesis PqqD family chaperone [Paenibacillus sp. MBLB1832]